MARQATLELLADASKLKSGLADAGGQADRFGGSFGKVAGIVAGAFSTAAVIKFGADSVKAFDESAQAQSKLELALQNSKATVGLHASAFAALNTKLAQHTLADDDVIAATEAQMVTFGASKKQIESMIPTVLDFAAKMGVDGPTAADLFDKAALGSTKALKALGIEGYKPTHDKAKDLANIQELLKDKVKGAAQAQLDAAGPGAVLKKHMDELEESVGRYLVPALTKAVTAISGVVDWLGNLVGLFQTSGFSGVVQEVSAQWDQLWPKIQAILSSVLEAIGSWIVNTAGPYLKAQFPVWIDAFWQWIKDVTPPALKALGDLVGELGAWLLNTGLPMLGKALLALGDALWHWIQDAAPPALGKLVDLLAQLGSWILNEGVPKLIGFMADMTKKLIDWIADAAPKLPGQLGSLLGKIGAWIVTEGIPQLVVFTAKLEVTILEWLVNAAKAAPGKIKDVIVAVAGWLKDNAPGLIADAMKLIVAAIEAPFKLLFNTIGGFWNNTIGKISFSVPDWVPGLGGKGFSFPIVPPLAAGGPINGLALVGERGPELFAGTGTIIPNNALGGGGNTYHLTVTAIDPAAAASAVVAAIQTYEQRNGTNWRN